MSTATTKQSSGNIAHGINRFSGWFSRHWLAAVNTFFFIYVGLPVLAPILLANGHSRSANVIYWIYHFLCHQFPSRAHFVAGEQVALCHRCIAIHGTILIGGLLFILVRHRLKPLNFKWYIFFLLPIALDGGLGFASELAQFIPMVVIWAIGLITIGAVAVILYSQKSLTWHGVVLLSFGLLALIYLQYFGPHVSNVYLRSITGFLMGVGTIWFAYPAMDQDMGNTRYVISPT